VVWGGFAAPDFLLWKATANGHISQASP
jgi:hypothetical protein